jgi:hypothetical protein
MIQVRLLNIRQLEFCGWEVAEQNFKVFKDIGHNINVILDTVLVDAGVSLKFWHVDHSVEALDSLGKLIPKIINGREMTLQEKQKTEAELSPIHQAVLHGSKVLDVESEYILNLIGIYMGELLISANIEFFWELDKRKKSISYKQPILKGIDKIPYQPMMTMNAVGYRIILDKVNDAELGLIYKNLEKILKGIYH